MPPAEAGTGAAVGAVVVSYRPDARLDAALDAILPQVGAVWAVDNGSGEAVVERLRRRAAASGGRLRLIANPENRGLAAAQNQGIRAALADGRDWVLLLDQDSIPAPDMVAELLAAATGPDAARIGLVAPRLVEELGAGQAGRAPALGGLRSRRVRPGETARAAAFAAASGSLIPAARPREIGEMNEALWIDQIDKEFCLRLRRAGYRIAVVGTAELSHRFGRRVERRLLGLRARYSVHDPRRLYTIWRNGVWMARRFRLPFPAFAFGEVLHLGRQAAKLALEPGRARRWRAAWRGFRDGWAGRGGPPPDDL